MNFIGLMRNTALAGLAVIGLSQTAYAATATTTMSVTLTINAGCTVTAGSLAFGSAQLLSVPVTASTTVIPTCTNTTPYTVLLDAGSGTGATVAARKLTNGSNTVTYSLYQDAAFSTVWGNTAGQTVAGTGNGNAQSLTVYGRIPAQAGAPPGSYADVINVTVAY